MTVADSWPTSPTEPTFLTVDGLTIRISLAGTGRPLLMLNGIGSNIEMWSPLRSLLAERRTIAFDAPGTGESTTPRRPLRMAGLARIVVELLDQLEIDDVDVFGFSFGGMLAQQLAHDHSMRVRRMVLAATTCGVGGVIGKPSAMRVIFSARRYRDPVYLAKVAPYVYGGRAARDPSFLNDQNHARVARPPSSLGYANQLAATMGWSSLRWLHRLRQPTLVLGGGLDPLTPVANARLIAATMRQAELHIFPDGGHLFALDSPGEVARLVLEWTD